MSDGPAGPGLEPPGPEAGPGPGPEAGPGPTSGAARRVGARAGAGRPDAALVAALAVLAAWNLLVRARIDDERFRAAAAAALGVIVLCIGIAGGRSRAELGLSAARLPAGMRWGGGAALAVGLVLSLAALIPATRHLLADPRAEVSGADMLIAALVTIPLGTVLLEECAFRGTLLALLLPRVGRLRAAAATATLFGLWHLPPIVAGSHDGILSMLSACAGVFVVTAAAGAVFAWLRLRSGSLLAAGLAHVATNSGALIVAWAVAR